MIKGFNEWYIDVNIAPTADQLNSRWKGIETFLKDATKNDVCNLVSMYYGLSVEDKVTELFAKQFSDIDPSFSARNAKELSLLSGAALAKLVTTTGPLASLAELLVVINNPYHNVVTTPQIASFILQQFEKDRYELRELELCNFDLQDDDTLMNFKKSVLQSGWSDDLRNKLIDILISIQQKNEKQQNELLASLSIFMEDSQILWWMTSQWSNILDKPLNSLDRSGNCLVLGFEAANFVHNYPGPYAMEGVINKVVSACNGSDISLPLPNVLKDTNPEWKNECINNTRKITSIINLTPLHAAINSEKNTTSDTEWYPKFKREILLEKEFLPIPPKEYAYRMYLEELALKCYDNA